MEFRFTLDGTRIDDPVGWEESKTTIERNKELRGIFVKYVSQLEFHNGQGSAYDLIRAAFDANPCNTMVLLIESKCSPSESFSTFFNGIIFLSEVKFNISDCFAMSTIEDNSLSALLNNNKDLEITFPINEDGFSISGQNIADPTTICAMHTSAVITNDVVSYRLRDAIQYLLDFITDKQVTFDSGFFKTETNQIEIHRFTPTGLGGGSTIVIAFDNVFGNTVNLSVPWAGSLAATLTDLEHDLHVQASAANRQNIPGVFDRFTYAASDGGIIDAESWLPITNVSCSVTGGGSCTFVKTQSITEGARDYSLSSASLLNDRDGAGGGALEESPMILTFGGLIDNLADSFGIWLNFKTGASPSLEIERLETFLNEAQAFQINNVRTVTLELADDFLAQAIRVGGKKTVGAAGTFIGFYRGMFTSETWGINNCLGDEVNAKNSWIILGEHIRNLQSGANTYAYDAEDTAFWEVDGATGTESEQYRYRQRDVASGIYIGADGVDPANTSTTWNAFLNNARKVLYNIFGINGTTFIRDETRDITNTEGIKIKLLQSFSHPLSNSDFKTILNNNINFIDFSETTTGHIRGWIDKLEYDNKTGLTDFKLLTE